MISENRNDHLATKYKNLHEGLMKLLYDEDPEGMGSTVGAPEDEYSAEARKLIVELRSTRTEEEISRVVLRLFPDATTSLVHGIFGEWSKFLKETNPD